MESGVSIILQGYSVSKESLNLVVDSYLRYGYTDIIVSSYTWCVDHEYLQNKVDIIYNDDFFNEHEPLFIELTKNIEDEVFKKNHKKRLNVNYQIQTTLAGINRALEIFPNNEFAIKQRCDMMLLNLDHCIESNLKKVRRIEGVKNPMFTRTFFESILTHEQDWVYNDQFYFTSIDNLKKIFDIPFVKNWSRKPEQYIMHTYISAINRKFSWEEFNRIYCISWNVTPILYWFKTYGILAKETVYFPYKQTNYNLSKS